MKKIIAVLIIILMSCSAGFAFMNDIKARRGCCSHHGGVCGCSNSGGLFAAMAHSAHHVDAINENNCYYNVLVVQPI